MDFESCFAAHAATFTRLRLRHQALVEKYGEIRELCARAMARRISVARRGVVA
jgi:hypothetical protein